MQYEKEILNNLLVESGITHRLDDRITPIKHPYMRRLEKRLKYLSIKYTYFPDTDSLAVTSIDGAENDLLCHTLMMPCDIGISVIMLINEEEGAESFLEEVAKQLGEIIPNDLGYNVVGVL